MGPPKHANAPLIKGYLPVRLTIPSSDSSVKDETYFYVKEHQAGNVTDKKNNCTLFVSNAPVVPTVRTRLLLKSLFGRFGDIARVTVISNPRQNRIEADTSAANAEAVLSSWTDNFHLPTYLGPQHAEGKFAHVVFTSNKEMKRSLKALQQIMLESTADSSGLTLDKIEIQTLADESERQYRQEQRDTDGSDDDDMDDDFTENRTKKKLTGVLKVAERYRESCSRLSRAALLEECNAVMENFEDAETQDRMEREAAANEPDDDGFVTVTYSSQVGSKRELEQTGGAEQARRGKGQKRRRKTKDSGATELEDFYRFQTKQHRKKSLQELRERFEEDLKKVKRMKEENQYRPF
jgi:hypothetical protein